VLSSAQEALERLQRGESGLAVSPLCGTNIAVAGFLAAAASTGALVGSARRSDRFSRAFTAAMLGVIVAQPIGRLVQKYVTTSPDLAGVEIVAIRSVVGSLKKVQTRSIAAP
jgi:biotin transporter BioY